MTVYIGGSQKAIHELVNPAAQYIFVCGDGQPVEISGAESEHEAVEFAGKFSREFGKPDFGHLIKLERSPYDKVSASAGSYVLAEKVS